MIGEIYAFEKQKISTMFEDFDRPIFLLFNELRIKKSKIVLVIL